MDSVALGQLALRPGITAPSSGHQVTSVGIDHVAAANRFIKLDPGQSCRAPAAIGMAYASIDPACGEFRKTARRIGINGSSRCAVRMTMPPMLNPSTLTGCPI